MSNRCDLIGTAVDHIQGLYQVRFLDQRQLDGLFQPAREFVVGEQVGRVRHAHDQSSALRLKNDGSKAARLDFRQQAYDRRAGCHLPDIQEWNL